MRKLIVGLIVASFGFIAMAPAANALVLTVPLVPVTVTVLEPTAPLVDVNLNADVAVLPVLNDPLVHVCVNGVVQSVLLSAAVNLHLDVLGSDSGCVPPVVVPPSTTGGSDPLVHVCVNGVVESVLASAAVNLHLDVLGSDAGCAAGGTVTPPPPPGNGGDPLVHVCVNGVVNSVLASVALNLHLDVLGVDNKCPVVVKPPVVVEPPVVVGTGTGTPAVSVTPVSDTGTVAAPVLGGTPSVVAAPVTKKSSGPLAFTGNGWIQLLFGLGLASVVAGFLFRRLAVR